MQPTIFITLRNVVDDMSFLGYLEDMTMAEAQLYIHDNYPDFRVTSMEISSRVNLKK